MAGDNTTLRIVAKMQIKKYAEGVEPIEGNPFELVEKEMVFMGKEAEAVIKQLKEEGVDLNGSN